MLLAHIAGIPVEETALSMAPVASVIGGAALVNLRRGVFRRSQADRRPRPPAGESVADRRPRR
jgi:hypothetical protein